MSRFGEFPAEGACDRRRARARFLRGEDALTLAWVGTDPRAVGADGAVRALPRLGREARRVGQALDGVIGAVGTGIR